MIFLYVIIFIIAILLLIPFLRIHIVVEYFDELKLFIKILGIKFKIFPQKGINKGKKSNNKKRKSNVKTKNNNSKLIGKYKGVKGFISMIKDFSSIGYKTLCEIFSKMEIKSLHLQIIVASDDSARTAILYGQVCSTIYPFVNMLTSSKNCSDLNIDIHPDFNNPDSKVKFSVHLYSKVFNIINSIRFFMKEYSKLK